MRLSFFNAQKIKKFLLSKEKKDVIFKTAIFGLVAVLLTISFFALEPWKKEEPREEKKEEEITKQEVSVLGEEIVVTSATSGTWTAPEDVTEVTVEVWGAGGGSIQPENREQSGGGGGGAYSRSTLAVTPGVDYSYVVGQQAYGVDGGDSYWVDTSTLLAKGGQAALDPLGGDFGAGGSAANGVGDVRYSGGDGGLPSGGNGGGGGGAAGSTGDGSSATNRIGGAGAAEYGGDGGDGSLGAGQGGFGQNYGGGAGGNARHGGQPGNSAGANGFIRITYVIPPDLPVVGNPEIYSGNVYGGDWFNGEISLRASVTDSGGGLDTTSCEVSINAGAWTGTGVTYSTGYCQYNNYTPNADFSIKFRIKDNSENWGESNLGEFTYDNIAPTTTATTTSPPGGSSYTCGNWTNDNVRVVLSCEDNVGGSGCDASYPMYCTDINNTCNPTTSYTGNIDLTTEGTNYIRYFSSDNLANEEAVQSCEIKIDKTNPEVSASNASETWYETQRTATVSATDAHSGIAEVRYSWDNNDMDASCTTGGTITSHGATLNAPEGGTTLYLCARDNVGKTNTWSGIYNWGEITMLEGYAWSENLGWISFNCINDDSCATSNFNVYASGSNLNGYAWSENFGWLSFNPDMSYHPDAPQESAKIDTDGTVCGEAGRACGWARFCSATVNSDCASENIAGDWNGWINLGPEVGNYVTFNELSGDFSGSAWDYQSNDEINFNCEDKNSCAENFYKVFFENNSEYTVTYTSSAGGDITPGFRTIKHYKTSDAPTISADTGYEFVNFEITLGGGNGYLNTETGAVVGVSGDMTIQGNFEDNTPPELYASNASETWYETQRTAVVHATDTGSGIAEVRYNWGVSSELSANCDTGGTVTSHGANLNAPPGGTTLYLCARDNAGNTATWSGTYNWTADGPTVGAPEIYSGNSYNNTHFNGTISLRSTVTDIGGGLNTTSCEVSINEGAWTGTGVTYSAGYCQYNNYTPNANFTIKFRIQDDATNWGESTLGSFTHDNTAPTTTATMTSPPGGTAYTCGEFTAENVRAVLSCEDTANDPEENGLVLHLDASAITGLNDNDPIETWQDLSGSGNNATQATLGNRPIYKTNVLNGQPVVRGDGSKHMGLISQVQNTGSLTYFFVGNINNDSFFFAGLGSGTSAKMGLWGSSFFLRLVAGDTNDSSINWTFNNNHILFTVTRDINDKVDVHFDSSNANRLYNDNTHSGTATIDTLFTGEVGTQDLNGDIAEILIYDRALTTEEREEVEQYLGVKWLGWEGSGCHTDSPKYCTDSTNTCTPTTTYSTNIDITTEGTSYVRYFSSDNLGNDETVQSCEIIIDTANDDPTLSAFTIGGQNALGLTNVVVSNPETDPGAELWVADFTDFSGIVATTNDVNATRTVTLNGTTVAEENLAAQTVAEDDVIVVTVVAEDGTTTQYYKVTTKRIPNDDTTLSTFTVGGQDALGLTDVVVTDPAIDPGAELWVADFTGFAGIVATPTDENATRTVTLNESPVTEGDLATQAIAEDDVVVVTVTAEDETTIMYYKVTAKRVLGTDATLSAFTIGGEDTLGLTNVVVTDPATDPGAELWVSDFTNFTGIVATPTDGNATRTVTLNGFTVEEENLASQIIIDEDIIVVTVVSEDENETKYYKVTAKQMVGDDATLSTFTVGGENVLGLQNIEVTNPETSTGAELWLEDLTNFEGIVATTTDENATRTVTLNGNPVAEGNLATQAIVEDDVIVVTVVSEDESTTKYYKVTVKRILSDDATLSTFTLGGENVLNLNNIVVTNPETQSGATLTVANFTGFEGIVATPTDENAIRSVTLNGTAVIEGNLATQEINPNDTVVVTVTAEDGTTTKYYKVTAAEEVGDIPDQILQSSNYKIIAPQLSSGGDFLTDENQRYSISALLGQTIYDPRTHSDSYSMTSFGSLAFEPNIPEVACFETTSDEASACSTGPEYLNTHGMVRVCGPNGCYNRARFEINANDNPADTLYGVQISTDGFENDIRYVDGNTFMPKEERTITDYKTKEDWETPTFNLLGLESDTGYQIRITALYGDLSESAHGPAAQATTALSEMSFRIGLGYEDGVNINYNPPYEIRFDESFRIQRGANVISSDRLIWSLINTNATSGVTLIQKGEHGGLHNTTESYTINSLSGDLGTANEGIGFKNNQISQLYSDGITGSLASLTSEPEYDDAQENTVGIIDTVFRKTYESDGPVHTGETGLQIKTKASLTTPEGNYFEDVTFVLIANY